MGLRVDTATVHGLGSNPAKSNVDISTANVHVCAGGQPSRTFIDTMTINVLAKRPDPSTYSGSIGDHIFCGTATVHVFSHRTPLFEWNEMLYYDVFPTDIGYNSVGATRFTTDVVMVDSGADQRTARWDQPLMEYDVAYGVRDIIQLNELVTFFRTMRGRLYSFLFYDPSDHTSSTQSFIDYTIPDVVSYTDQYLGTGDAVTKVFQLIKTYTLPSGDLTQVRPITKPVDGSVIVAINATAVTNFTVDKMTGLLTFTPRIALTNLQGMSLIYPVTGAANPTNAATVVQLVSPTAIFYNFNVNDKIVMSGWATGVNNTNESMRLTITAVSPDFTTLTLSTDISTWVGELSRSGLEIYIHPAPHAGDMITSGYSFYVPVRFDTDRLPITLEEYGIGGAADVKLIEVRPWNL